MTVVRKESSAASDSPRSAVQAVLHVLQAAWRSLAAAMSRFHASREVSEERRALLRGEFWRFQRSGTNPEGMVRYPRNRRDLGESSSPSSPSQRKTIAGISIEPVPATNLGKARTPRPVPLFRPPGAIAESQFLRDCTRCRDCITACPYDAIDQASERFGPAAGTPIIDADKNACQMCSDFPCITACEPDVLRYANPKSIGVARVTAQLCLAYNGTICTVCSERCPVPDAISLAEGKPLIVEDVCTGCGVCRYVCPAPENAILLMPMLTRGTWEAS